MTQGAGGASAAAPAAAPAPAAAAPAATPATGALSGLSLNFSGASSALANPFTSDKKSGMGVSLQLGGGDSPFTGKDTRAKEFLEDAKGARAPDAAAKRPPPEPRPGHAARMRELPLAGVHFDRIFPGENE
jgi:hypothetical protein